jgi:hypothetical protein
MYYPILYHRLGHSPTIRNNIRLPQSQDLRVTAGKTSCATNRTTKPNGVPRVREWPKVERHVLTRDLRGTMPQTTTWDPKRTCTEFLRREKCCLVVDISPPDEIFPVARVYIRAGKTISLS